MKTNEILNVKSDNRQQCFLSKLINIEYRFLLIYINIIKFSKLPSKRSYCAFFLKDFIRRKKIIKTKYIDIKDITRKYSKHVFSSSNLSTNQSNLAQKNCGNTQICSYWMRRQE